MNDIPEKWRFVKMKQKMLIDSRSDSIVTLVLPFDRWWTSEEEGEEVVLERGGELVSSHSGLVREGWSCKRSRIRERSRSWLRSSTRRRVDGGVGLGLQQEEEEEVGELRRWRREIPPRQAVVSD